jgi:N utilization substance protein A
MALVEGKDANGATLDQESFDVAGGLSPATSDAAEQVVAAILGTRESAAEGAHHLVATGVAWTDHAVAARLRQALKAQRIEDVVLVSELHAASALAQAIGRSGQNVRLASQLTGWTINVMSTEEAAEKHEAEAGEVIQMFVEQLDIDDEVAEILVEEGFTTLEEVAYVPLDEMTAIEGFDADIAEELRARAKDALLTQAIASEEQLGANEPAQDLLEMEGMDRHLAYVLASRGVITMEDLAELGVDELTDIPDMTEERAGELIMTARAPWFAEESE